MFNPIIVASINDVWIEGWKHDNSDWWKLGRSLNLFFIPPFIPHATMLKMVWFFMCLTICQSFIFVILFLSNLWTEFHETWYVVSWLCTLYVIVHYTWKFGPSLCFFNLNSGFHDWSILSCNSSQLSKRILFYFNSREKPLIQTIYQS